MHGTLPPTTSPYRVSHLIAATSVWALILAWSSSSALANEPASGSDPALESSSSGAVGDDLVVRIEPFIAASAGANLSMPSAAASAEVGVWALRPRFGLSLAISTQWWQSTASWNDFGFTARITSLKARAQVRLPWESLAFAGLEGGYMRLDGTGTSLQQQETRVFDAVRGINFFAIGELGLGRTLASERLVVSLVLRRDLAPIDICGAVHCGDLTPVTRILVALEYRPFAAWSASTRRAPVPADPAD